MMRAILTYHSIDDSGSPISCSRDAFDRHLTWLTSGRVQVTSLADLAAGSAPADAVALTFDDGFVNFEAVAAPRLLEHGLLATVFVVADRAGATNAWRGRPQRNIPELPLMDWEALGRLREAGFMLGSHTRTHPDLTRLPVSAIEDEVHGAAETIAANTGGRPSVLAYPYGRVDARTAAVAASAHEYACTTEFRQVTPVERPVWLPRLDMYYFQHPGSLEGWGTPALARFIARRRRLRRLRRAAEAAREMLSWSTRP